MKHIIAIVILLALALPIFANNTGDTVGRIRLPSHGITAWVTMPEHDADCDCPILWNGGIVYTDADLSAVSLYDTMHLYTMDGSHHVLECVEITPCVQYGRFLLGLYGPVRDCGDLLVFSRGRVYRWTRS